MRATVGILSYGSDLWTPEELDGTTGLRWYKADDSATVLHTSNNVDTWQDKFSAAKHLTGTTTTRPTTNATTLNSKNVLDFAGDYVTAGAAADWKFLHDGTEYMVSMVVKCGTGSNPNAAYGLWGTNGTSSNNIGSAFFYDDRASASVNESFQYQVTRGVAASFPSNMNTQNGTGEPNKWLIVTVLGDPDNGTALERAEVYVNRGYFLKFNSASAAVSASNPTYAFQLGAGGNNTAPLTGSIAEVVVTSSHADRFQVENYLNREWGLPYKWAHDASGPVTAIAA